MRATKERTGRTTRTAPPESVFVVGALGTIEDVDEAACALLGYARPDLVGQHGGELVPGPARPATAVSLDRMRRGELASVRDGQLRRRDGIVVEVDVRAERLPGSRLKLHVSPRSK